MNINLMFWLITPVVSVESVAKNAKYTPFFISFIFIFFDMALDIPVDEGSPKVPTDVQVVLHNRSQRVLQHWELVKMSGRSHKARCKCCGCLLGVALNSTLDKHMTRILTRVEKFPRV